MKRLYSQTGIAKLFASETTNTSKTQKYQAVPKLFSQDIPAEN